MDIVLQEDHGYSRLIVVFGLIIDTLSLLKLYLVVWDNWYVLLSPEVKRSQPGPVHFQDFVFVGCLGFGLVFFNLFIYMLSWEASTVTGELTLNSI